MNRVVATIAAACATLSIGQGCAQRSKVDKARGPHPLQLLEELPANGSVKADDFRFAETGQLYQVVEKDSRLGDRLTYHASKTDQFNATMSIAEGDLRTQFLRNDEHGNIMMTAVIDHKENVISLFEPPMVIAYNELEAGKARTSKSTMRVVDAKDQSKQRESGKATRTIKYDGDQRIRTPLGEFVAKRVEVKFRADLNLADATETSMIYLVPEKGIIAEQVLEKRKILGAFGDTARRTLVRLPASR